MSYSSEVANLIANQISRFMTLNRYQLAGQAANLDFWLSEARHAVEVIDRYGQRFEQMKSAQSRFVTKHETLAHDRRDEFSKPKPPEPPIRVSDVELKHARRAVTDSAYRFFVRSANEGFITESRLREACDNLGISVEATDLKRCD
ncbi:MAG: hypothetical protein WCH39_00025 [Schlesneria sp.]